MAEKVPGIHLVNRIMKRKAQQSRSKNAPKGLSGWAKAQMMMVYAIEHDEMWCHRGFLEVRCLLLRIFMTYFPKVYIYINPCAWMPGTKSSPRQLRPDFPCFCIISSK